MTTHYSDSAKRQENLYATYTNIPNKCWYHLAKENQRDFNSSGTKGKCIEARELVIMLPPSLYEYDHELLLKYFSSVFTEKYDVPVNAALHHNKKKTNFHIHLIFSERRSLDEPERKIAKRNMFYDENGKLTVFTPGGPYLPTKKIGKNNPKEQEIKDNNHLRQEWNRMVDRGLIEGMTEEELVELKRQHVDNEVAKSVKEHGNQPNLFTELLQRAIGKLRALIDFFIIFQNAEKDENGEALLYEDVVVDITPAALPPRDKGPYPSSELEKLEVIKHENIDKRSRNGLPTIADNYPIRKFSSRKLRRV